MANKSPLVLNAGAIEQLQSGDGIIAAAFASSAGIVLVPSGTGGVQVGTGGNARGQRAVDLQLSRTASTQVASGTSTFLAGTNNTNASNYSAVIGGYSNVANTQTGTGANAIIGGWENTITESSSVAFVGCRLCQNIGDPVNNSYYNGLVGGLSSNLTYVRWAGAVGVRNCNITGTSGTPINYCAMVGCYNCSITATNSAIIGGQACTISGIASAIVGGVNHTITSTYSSILGGFSNAVAGNYAAVTGGRDNYASGYSSLSSGIHARATRHGQHAHSAGRILNNGDAQTSVLIFRNQTDDDAKTELFLDGVDDRLILPPNTSWTYRYQLIGRCTSGLPTVAVYGATGWGVIDRDGSSNTTLLHAVNEQSEATPQHYIDADDTNESLKVSVNGEESCYFSWVCTVWLTELTGTGTDQQTGVVEP